MQSPYIDELTKIGQSHILQRQAIEVFLCFFILKMYDDLCYFAEVKI